MAYPDLTTPRRLTFDADVLEGLSAPWPRWPRDASPRPFDLDACLALVAKARPGAGVSLDDTLPPRDNAITREEAAFWVSILIDRESVYQYRHRRKWARERFAELGEDPSLDAVLKLVKTNLYDAPRRPHLVHLMRALRALAPWHRVVQTYLEDVRLHRTGPVLRHLGYCPEDEREAAAEVMRSAAADYAPDQWHTQGVFDAFLNLPIPEVVDRALDAALAQGELADFRGVYELALFSNDHTRLDTLVHGKPFVWTRRHVLIYLARRGMGDLDAFLDAVMKPRRAAPPRPVLDTLAAFTHVKAPEVVSRLHPHVAMGGEPAAAALAILDEAEPEHAALGLITSCARAGKRRTWSIERLRELAERDGGREAIEAALPSQRQKLADFVRAEVLDHHDEITYLELDDAPDWVRRLANLGKRKIPPPWLHPDDLPPVVLADSGLALPSPCAAGLVIADADRDTRTAADAARARLTHDSLVALSEALMRQWIDAPAIVPEKSQIYVKHARAAEWIARYPSPIGVRLLEDYLGMSKLPSRRHDRDSILERATLLLGTIDMPEAVAATFRLTRGRKKLLSRTAESALLKKEQDLGITRAELEDLAVPSFGLDARGRRDFDYGERTIRMFVAGGELLFEDLSKEKVTRIAPKGLKSDDVDRVATARAVFDVTVKPIRAELTSQSIRLEDAMLTGRTWRGRWWRERVLAHPLLGPMARSLVWSRRRGDAVTRLRPTEDGGFVDLDFDEHTIEDTDTLTLPHPLDMGADAVRDWAEHMLEFEVVQPFDQLARKAFSPEEARAEIDAFAAGDFTLDPKELRKREKSSPGSFSNNGYWSTSWWTFSGRDAPLTLMLDTEKGVSNKTGPRMYHAVRREGVDIPLEDLSPLEHSELALLLVDTRSREG